jgi:hypothetical protein
MEGEEKKDINLENPNQAVEKEVEELEKRILEGRPNRNKSFGKII